MRGRVAGFEEWVHGPPPCSGVPALARGYAVAVNLFAIVAVLLGLVLIAAGVVRLVALAGPL